MTGRSGRAERAGVTREQILTAAERLFAEHGVSAVSNRQVSEAAGQGNNAAVGYHFGTKTHLVRAIVRRHAEPIERRRGQLADAAGDSADVRDWVACLVRPVTEHLAALGTPTWYARFLAQVVTDPALCAIIIEANRGSASLRRAVEGFDRCLPDLPADVRAERGEMARRLIVHTCADRERALAEGAPTSRPSWHDAATGLIDALVGLWLAPVTRDPAAPPT
ncbi:TetR family transcriptional regulator [Microtetraspora sp. NBRC 13810]|uniref:TetR/AcrR family transcriptional regulator n=1 Tax=Microtetraspora sp. NBRC 13810 TaxID=3030990 RepID=UPI0024A40510|nr:TetR family transcriptional regulator [Microtetraspora sp. NBRC 13810]GLW11654.1 TetR family transcriptional regulator [Microtetraspora sp. NBRC 13810]